MTRVLHFVKKPEVRKYDIQNIKFELEINEHIFPPSPHGKFFAENMKINAGETVIDVRQGNYFANFNKKFDVIVANLPQEIVHKNYQKAIGKQLTKSFDGGLNGNKQLLEFLSIAKNYMHYKSCIYLIVYTVTNYALTLKKMC